ncbi:MAG: hypothetical protein ACOZF0_18290 [Thermodesulfobacteriota bacterium]
MKAPKNIYEEAHLIVAAVRVLAYTRHVPPAVEDVGAALSLSLEEANRICRKLKELEIIDIVEGAFGTKLYVRDHLRIENLPRDGKDTRLEEELKKFQDAQKHLSKKVESIQAEQTQKRKELFAKLNQQLKGSLDKK